MDINDLLRQSLVPSAVMSHGGKTVGATAVQLSSSSVPLVRGVTIRFGSENEAEDLLYVGFANTITAGSVPATDGYPLEPGEELWLPVDNLNKVWLIASGATKKAYYLGS